MPKYENAKLLPDGTVFLEKVKLPCGATIIAKVEADRSPERIRQNRAEMERAFNAMARAQGIQEYYRLIFPDDIFGIKHLDQESTAG